MAGALIIVAELAPGHFSWIEGLRRAHYPPDRNRVPAHLTMFHGLPPSSEAEVRTRLAQIVQREPPAATVAGLLDLGGGVAFQIVSPGLDRIREELARDLHGLLSAQDGGGWRPHVTIQNKVSPRAARELKGKLERKFEARPLGIRGLGLRRYLDGPWERLADYSFR